MSTRAQVRFATREEGVTFSEHPEKIHAQFYVHSDGYPEGLGLDIAMSLVKCDKINNWEIEFLYQKHADLEYIYYVWQKPNSTDTTWISIFEVKPFVDQIGECIFVGKPQKLITKYGSQLDESYYKLNTDYDG
jgi:hypothetical protein